MSRGHTSEIASTLRTPLTDIEKVRSSESKFGLRPKKDSKGVIPTNSATDFWTLSESGRNRFAQITRILGHFRRRDHNPRRNATHLATPRLPAAQPGKWPRDARCDLDTGLLAGCPGCFDPQTHPFSGGEVVSIGEHFQRIARIGPAIRCQGHRPWEKNHPPLHNETRNRRYD